MMLPVSDGHPRWIGLDLAKRETQMAVLDKAGRLLFQKRVATTRELFHLLADELTVHDTVALEVTTNATAIARILMGSPARIILSNPIKTKAIAEAKIKTDKIDARVLAELARVDYLPQVWLPDPTTQALRHLMSDRRSLVDRRTELKNTVHAILHRNLLLGTFSDHFGTSGRAWIEGIIASDDQMPKFDRLRLSAILLELDRLEASLGELEGVIAAAVLSDPVWKANLDRLLTIPGVALVVAAGLLSAIGDIGRFKRPESLACYFGLVPTTYQTGDRPARHGRITKQGRSEARWLLVEAAEHLRQAPGPARALYQRVHARRGHNVAVVAVARKLAELIWHLLTKQENYLYQRPRRTLEKRAAVRHQARQATGKRIASATPRPPGRPVLYGTGLAGRVVKGKIAALAAERAEAIHSAIVEARASGHPAPPADFDPTRPTNIDWERFLEKITQEFIAELRADPATAAKVASRPANRHKKKVAAGPHQSVTA